MAGRLRRERGAPEISVSRPGSRLVRLSERTVALLDALRARSPRHVASYDQVVADLVATYVGSDRTESDVGSLQSGLPRRSHLPVDGQEDISGRPAGETRHLEAPRRAAGGSR